MTTITITNEVHEDLVQVLVLAGNGINYARSLVYRAMEIDGEKEADQDAVDIISKAITKVCGTQQAI